MQPAPRISPRTDPFSRLSRVAGLGCLFFLVLEGIDLLLAVLAPLALVGLSGFTFTQVLVKNVHARSTLALAMCTATWTFSLTSQVAQRIGRLILPAI